MKAIKALSKLQELHIEAIKTEPLLFVALRVLDRYSRWLREQVIHEEAIEELQKEK